MYLSCKNCKTDLDAGDVFDVLRKKEKYRTYSDNDLASMCNDMYGWSTEKKIRFGNQIVVKVDDKPLVEACPSCNVIEPFDKNVPIKFVPKAFQDEDFEIKDHYYTYS